MCLKTIAWQVIAYIKITESSMSKQEKFPSLHHVTGPALYCPLLADVLAELVGVTCWRKTLR